MLEIISICLNIITIGLTIYELFSKKSSNGTKQYIQNNIIQQINPKYDINVSSGPTCKLDSVAIKITADWVILSDFQRIFFIATLSNLHVGPDETFISNLGLIC